MKRYRLLLSILALAAFPLAAQIPGDITLDPAFGAEGFSFPVGVRNADDGSDRKFVIERGGTIRVVDAGGSVLSEPFLDIASTTSSGGEYGLLGLAFHPDYANNGRVYVKHSADNITGVTDGDTMIAEYQVDALDPDELDPNSREVIMVIPQDSWNHNGGDLHFGPDGYLYIGMGDGGGSNDPCNRGQTLDPSTTPPESGCETGEAAWLLGKMLRIDVDGTTPAGSNNLCAAGQDGSAGYAVPGDNPFAGQVNRCGEVWSYGQRNPYRFSFDRDTGDMWVGDVGQNHWEEVNFEPAGSSGGGNYGWKICEGNWLRGSTSSPCTLPGHIAPVLEFPSTGSFDECSVTGGYRYRGPITSMQGYYVYGDYCSGRVWFAEESSPGNWSSEEFGQLPGNLVGFGEDEDGNLYITRGSGEILVFNGDVPPTYSVGGTVNGLEGSGLVLQNNDGDDLAISANGSFTFPTELESGEDYEVSVATQPGDPLQECAVANGSGTIGSADVIDVAVDCVTLDDVVFEDRFEETR